MGKFILRSKAVFTGLEDFPRPAAIAVVDKKIQAVHRWDYHRDTGYQWWISRMSYCFRLYDVVRIDHFRGFDEYFSIPYGDKDARGGHWEKGPGIDLFRKIEQALGWKQVIAEDLGYMTDSVRHLVYESGFPGMKVLEFAFDSRDSGCASDYLPHNYPENCVAYTGTHDNDTIVGWMNTISEEDAEYAKRYMRLSEEEGYHWGMMRTAWASVADTAIMQMQDILGLGSSARMNTPSTLSDKNWSWRCLPGAYNDTLAECLHKDMVTYGRVQVEKEDTEDEKVTEE